MIERYQSAYFMLYLINTFKKQY